jgi:tetratricopeptide (TPR) repeat protein
MKSDAAAFGVAGMVFGLVAGWIIGTQQAGVRQASEQTPPAARAPAGSGAPTATVLDESKVTAFKSVAEREPNNPKPRVDLANLYFDAERFDDAIKWYGEALKLTPRDVDVSTDLGVSYYYTNQPDKALAQFEHSLSIDPKHAKTLLNLGVVRAFGKQDLAGAQDAWQRVVEMMPGSPEAEAAKRALDSLKSAHPPTGGSAKPGA